MTGRFSEYVTLISGLKLGQKQSNETVYTW